MNADFEKWFKSQLTIEGDKYYFLVGAYKVYVFFEGERATITEAYLNMRMRVSDTKTIETGAKYHTGWFRFYIYGINALLPDKITDVLSIIVNEIIAEEAGSFRIQTGIISTKQRGNKFKGSSHYENIAELDYQHWKK